MARIKHDMSGPEVLPKGIKKSDLTLTSWEKRKTDPLNDHPNDRFDLWYTSGMGWVIPTLHISNARRGQSAYRTYAVIVSDGLQCRVGNGPHVLKQHTVYVLKSRLSDLQQYIDLRLKGEIESNEIRDARSSRSARTSARRRSGLYF